MNEPKRELALVGSPWNFEEAQRVATAFVASKLFSGSDSSKDEQVAQALVRITLGYSLNVSPAVAMSQIHIVKGHPMMAATLMAALVKRSERYDYRVTKLNNDGCTIQFLQGAEVIGTSEYTMRDAQTAGLAGGTNYRGNPRNMLYARAMSNGCRWFCPDVFMGTVYDEFETPAGDKPLDVPQLDIIEPTTPSLPTPAAPATGLTQADKDNAKRLELKEAGWPDDEVEAYMNRKREATVAKAKAPELFHD